MNEATHVNSANTIYRQRAEATKARRRAAGKYPTQRQRRAFARYLGGSIENLSPQEIDALATHPYLTEKQRIYFRELAQAN